MTLGRNAKTGVPDVGTTFHFFVDIDPIEPQAMFQECSALEVENEVFSYEEGGLNDHVHRLPGRTKISDITLKKGIVMNKPNPLWDWMLQTVKGEIERHHVTINVVDQHGETIQSWTLLYAFPIKWVGPALNSTQSNVAIQSLTLTHRGIIPAS